MKADAAVTYQWLRNGKPIKGATTNTLRIAKFGKANEGKYVLRASSAGKTVNSSQAVLQIARVTGNLGTSRLKVGKRTRVQFGSNFKARIFTAKGLPPGLKMDKKGFVSGTPTKKGSYKVTITAILKKGGKVTTKATAFKRYKVS